MRVLGTSIIVLSLAISAGGVAYRTQAGPQVAADESDAAGGSSDDSQQCEVTGEVASEPVVIDLGKLPAEASDAVRPLNRTGYNYREPGLWYPPQPVAPVPPAAPEED